MITRRCQTGTDWFLVDVRDEPEKKSFIVNMFHNGLGLEQTSLALSPFVDRVRVDSQQSSDGVATFLLLLLRQQQEAEVCWHQTICVQGESRGKDLSGTGKEVRIVLGRRENDLPIIGSVKNVVIFSRFKEHRVSDGVGHP